MSWNPDEWLNIPQVLQDIPQWMICQGKGEKAKQPLTLNGKNGDHTNPNNWSTFAEACMAAGSNPGWYPGFCFTKSCGFIFLDMDNKVQNDEYRQIILGTCDLLDTYIERSMNGDTHALLKGKYKPGYKHNKKPLEIYDAHFGILTGDVIKDRPISPDYQDWLDMAAEWCGQGSDNEQVPIDWTSPATEEELELDNRCLQWFATFPNVARIEYCFEGWDFADPNMDNSKFDAYLMQLYYKFNAWRPEQRERATVRMFLRSPRAHYLKPRKPDWQQYVARTLGFVKKVVDMEEIKGLQGAVDRMRAGLPGHINGNDNVLPFPSPAPTRAPPSIAPFAKQWDFKRVNVNQVATEPPPIWLLENILEIRSVNTMYGWSGTGKTFVALDLMFHIAQGLPWFGHRTVQKNGFYVGLEGETGFSMRLNAFRIAHGLTDLPHNCNIYRGDFDLNDDGCIKAFIEQGEKGEFIIIDTFARAVLGKDENDNGEMGLAIKRAELIRNELDACVLLLCHTVKPSATNQRPDIRGAGAITGNVEGKIGITKEKPVDENGKIIEDGTERHFMYMPKVRNSKSGGMHEFEYFDQDIGILNQYGESVTCPVIREISEVTTGLEQAVEEMRPMGSRMGMEVRGKGRGRPKWQTPLQQRIIEVVRKLGKVEFYKACMAVQELSPDQQQKRDNLKAFNKMVSEGCFGTEKVGEVDWVWYGGGK